MLKKVSQKAFRLSDFRNESLKFFYLFLIPFSFPMLDFGIGTISIFLVTIGVFFVHALLRSNFFFNKWLSLNFILSMVLLLLVIFVQNGSLFLYVPDDNTYIFRIPIFFVVLCFSINFVAKEFSCKHEALRDFTRSLFLLIVIATIFEYFLRGLSLQPILYLYKARQDLGGIDSVHYNRLSGFTSFPGDFAALVALCFVCVQVLFKSRIMLFVLFSIIMLTQSKAGIILLLLFYLFRSLLSFSLKGLILTVSSLVISLFLINFFELEYFIKFLSNLEYYFTGSKRAQEMIFFFNGDLVEKLFGSYYLGDMYFESELFSSLSRNGILGSAWFFLLLVFFIILLFVSRTASDKDLILFIILFLLFYCAISAGFSRSKISMFYIVLISIYFAPFRKRMSFG